MLVVLGKSLHATDFQCLRICTGFSGDIAKPCSDRWNDLWRKCKRSNDNSAQSSENLNFQEWFSGRTLKVSKGHGEWMRRGWGARERGKGNGGRRGGGARDMENRRGDVGSRGRGRENGRRRDGEQREAQVGRGYSGRLADQPQSVWARDTTEHGLKSLLGWPAEIPVWRGGLEWAWSEDL